MKKLFLGLLLLSSWKAIADQPATCVDFTGSYQLPSSAQDRVDGISNFLDIKQTECLGFDLIFESGGMFPVTPGYVFGKASDYDGLTFSIVGQTIVGKAMKGGYLQFYSVKHGVCQTPSFTMALDANKNLVVTAARISGCDDDKKYVGPGNETYLRVVTNSSSANTSAKIQLASDLFGTCYADPTCEGSILGNSITESECGGAGGRSWADSQSCYNF